MPEAGGPLAGRLDQGLEQLGRGLPQPARQRLLQYVSLLAKWNRVYNLTAVRDPDAMLVRHVLDSLAVLPWLHGRRVLDAGTGAGLPGLVLAIAAPEREFVLLDSAAKKLRFVLQAIAELGLSNARAVQARLERYAPDEPFDTLVSRALGSVAGLWRDGSRLLAADGILLAMKGARAEAETRGLPPGVRAEVIPLQVPLLGEARHLVRVSRSAQEATSHG